jgi:hypothetical protein
VCASDGVAPGETRYIERRQAEKSEEIMARLELRENPIEARHLPG